ncbi:serine/threonine-protein kinase [Streptomyces sp. TX20-6-3]|uniref:serine/threonine-protein kinase n=1 Tax=Streptomyces sp. TX20-6-3 TaxID=3028705 RepID=UPI0029BECAB7|nr:serine/threonine-protein kinase [Streptomyces sp. TX20-6-3]MDX2558614.1 serine/threonine-protein kinase [Streptomyces sp. TX20-6-3]
MRPLTESDPRAVGPYRLLYRLGEGGMGRVYLGRSRGGRTVALKVVHDTIAGDPGFRTRFAREVRAAQSLRGAGTVPVLDADPDAAVPWLATAYVPGPALSEAVTGHGPLPEPALWRLLSGLAHALEGVHGAGLVHRDVKPSNVLLSPSGPLLIDFGIARSADETALTGTGLVVGSPGFMSPEQAEGRPVGPAADVFSLGAVLAFAATGRGPFGGGSVAELLYRLVHHEPDLAGIEGRFAELVRGCLAKRPEDRPQVAGLAAVADAHRSDTGSWLPAPVVAAIAQKAEELLNADADAEDEPGVGTGTGPGAGREPGAGVGQGAGSDPGPGPGAVTAVLPPSSPQAPTSVLPARTPVRGPAAVPRARAASTGVPSARERAVRTLTSGLGRPGLGLFYLVPMVAFLIGGVDLLGRVADHPQVSGQDGPFQWAMNDWWRVPATLLLVAAMTGLHGYRRRLTTVSPGRLRLWSAGVALYWIALVGVLTLHLLWFLFVHNGYDYGDGGGRHYLWWVAMPVMIFGGGLSPVVLIAAAVRLVRA